MQHSSYHQRIIIRLLASFLLVVGVFGCQEQPNMPSEPVVTKSLDPAEQATYAKAIENSMVAEIHEDFELKLWASDSLVADPIAIDVDESGRLFFTRDVRLKNSEFDVRGHMDWATASIGFQTVEDRRQFLRTTFSPEKSEDNEWLEDLNQDTVHDWRDLTVEEDQVWRLEDKDGDGIADFAQLFIEDFHEEITDVTNGVLAHNGELFITQAPDVWRLKDLNGDGMADHKTSIAHGFGVHIGFSGHGMSGITMGPDGRIYWGIGDIGANITDQTGKQWKYPNQGVICRANPDGSDFEVYAAGLRNTHEFVFDQYGNIITEDNDGDHPGERERLLYVIYGHEAGWRINWQFGKYTDPNNNTYKVWMDEKLHIPRWEGQAAYIIPPIMNYHNGPTGMVYNPGTALGPKWANHFFLAEFVGAPGRSTINAFQLKPQGAGFEFAGEKQVTKGVLATGLAFGPEGALYLSDWIDGWAPNNKGRVWKLDVPNGPQQAVRQETKTLIQADYQQKNNHELETLLAFQDMRVRLKAQFELARRGSRAKTIFEQVLSESDDQFAKIHAIWGLGQLIRQGDADGESIVQGLSDKDSEVVAQAAKILGDVRYAAASDLLVNQLKHPNARVQFFAAEALGRMGAEQAVNPILNMLAANNNKDLYLRHAGVVALANIGIAEPLIELASGNDRSLKIAAVVALRRMQHEGVATFLNDKDEYIVTEAARAINDDWSIAGALPALAQILNETPFQNEPLIRRAINANLRLGGQAQLDQVAKYAQRTDVPDVLRAEAIATLGVWANPSPLDRVDGRFRGYQQRDAAPVKKVLAAMIDPLLTSKTATVQEAAALAAGKTNIAAVAPTLIDLLRLHPDSPVRVAALSALGEMQTANLEDALQLASTDQDRAVRVRALEIIADQELPVDSKANLFTEVLKTGTLKEQQTAIKALGNLKSEKASATLNLLLNKLNNNELNPGVLLELEAAVKSQDQPALNQAWESYQKQINTEDPVEVYMAALNGGNPRNGRNIFRSNETSQCTRCHVIWGEGSDVGPALGGVGERLSRKELLESLVAPSAQLAAGYAVETLTMDDGQTVAGYLVGEDDTSITLRLGNQPQQTYQKSAIKNRQTAPSAMPSMADLLSKEALRDVVAYLANLK